MSTPPRGRGRPALFNDTARAKYLAARRTGATQATAAASAGTTDRVVRYARKTDPDFRERDDQAAAAGRLARVPHDEYRYNHLKCRCPVCCKAAAVGRTGRRDRARKNAPIVPIVPPDQGSPQVFPLARAS